MCSGPQSSTFAGSPKCSKMSSELTEGEVNTLLAGPNRLTEALPHDNAA
jgi:hypothetical protein